MKTTAEMFTDLQAKNAAVATATRKTMRAGTPANFSAMRSAHKIARESFRAFWAQPDADDYARKALGVHAS